MGTRFVGVRKKFVVNGKTLFMYRKTVMFLSGKNQLSLMNFVEVENGKYTEKVVQGYRFRPDTPVIIRPKQQLN
jgi:hypothetical protein